MSVGFPSRCVWGGKWGHGEGGVGGGGCCGGEQDKTSRMTHCCVPDAVNSTLTFLKGFVRVSLSYEELHKSHSGWTSDQTNMFMIH